MIKIIDKQQYYTAMSEIEGYLQKGFSALTKTEDDRLEELSKAVEAWELKEYPMPMHPSFSDILSYVMNQKKFSQSEMSESLSISKSLFSEILNGKKQPNLEIVIGLHKTFGIDANVLIESIVLYDSNSTLKNVLVFLLKKMRHLKTLIDTFIYAGLKNLPGKLKRSPCVAFFSQTHRTLIQTYKVFETSEAGELR